MVGKNEAVIATIKKAGFSHIKLELEALLGRKGKFSSENYCELFIRSKISKKSLKKIDYLMFYYDHSVDSELTFTIPVEEIDIAIEVVQAFNAMAQKNGNGCRVEGAGMHFSVLTSSEYPSQRMLSNVNLANFTTEVTKLLPALFIGATSGNFTRGLHHRQPQISHSTKYSAIYTHGGTCLEYRLFETCYDRPEAIYEFLGVIARTLEFYIDPSKKVIELHKSFSIYQDEALNGFTSLPEQISIIKAQFKHLKPQGMTVKEFMQARGINLLVSDAKKREAVKIAKLKKLYEEHRTAQERLRSKPFDQYQEENLEYWRATEPNQTEDWYWGRITGLQLLPLEDENTYINNNLRTDRPLVTLNV